MSRICVYSSIAVLAIFQMADAQAADQPPIAEELPQLAEPVKHLGSLSCASASCHGRQDEQLDSSSVSRHEFALWLTHDPHARAGRTIQSRKFVRIVRRVSSGSDDGPADVAVEKRCAKCHAPDGNAHPTGVATAGFSCETCHGPARDWIAVHYEREVSRERLVALGMRDTKDLAIRARLCASCHVGDAERDVNHDMLAAGHPPLRFELSAYHDLITHKHWPAAERVRTPQFKAQLWAQGQAATIEATLHLLQSRAARAAGGERHAPWPELAEYDCFACHQRLRPAERFTAVGLKGDRSGMPGWQPWNLALAGQLVTGNRSAPALADLHREMNGSLVNDAARVRDLAAAAGGALDVHQPATAAEIVALLGPAIKRDAWWAARSQQLLALRAADLAIRDERHRLQPPPGFVTVTSGFEQPRREPVDERDRQWRSVAAALQFGSPDFEWPAYDWEGLGAPPQGPPPLSAEQMEQMLKQLVSELQKQAGDAAP